MAQSKDSLLKSYNNRLKEDIKSMLENFEGEKIYIKSRVNPWILF